MGERVANYGNTIKITWEQIAIKVVVLDSVLNR
jgi:hypothetical protein